MRKFKKIKKKVLAVCCSDVHLTLKPPAARSLEEDWMSAMSRPWQEIKSFNAPVLVAGDLFDYWKVEPELINWALSNLPPMVAIPGNHDLPYHRPDLVHRSAFQTLVHAGLITVPPVELPGLFVDGVPLNGEIPKPPKTKSKTVLLVHEFVWDKASNSYPGAPESGQVKRFLEKVSDWDYVIVGDNHCGFSFGNVFNCGTLMLRKANEINYDPRIGLISESGVEPFFLDVSQDKLSAIPQIKGMESADMSAFLEDLGNLQSSSLDFSEVVRNMAKSASQAVVKELERAME